MGKIKIKNLNPTELESYEPNKEFNEDVLQDKIKKLKALEIIKKAEVEIDE